MASLFRAGVDIFLTEIRSRFVSLFSFFLPPLSFLSFFSFPPFFFFDPSVSTEVGSSIYPSVDREHKGSTRSNDPRAISRTDISRVIDVHGTSIRGKQLERYSSQEDAGSRLASNATGYLKATNIEHDNDNDTWDSKRVTIPFRCFGNSSSISSAFRFFFLFENKTLKQLNQDSTSSNVEENKIGLSHRDRHVLIVEVQQSRQSCQINLYSGKASAERGREQCSLHFLATVLISASRAWQAITDGIHLQADWCKIFEEFLPDNNAGAFLTGARTTESRSC